jgi:hypothetical protein
MSKAELITQRIRLGIAPQNLVFTVNKDPALPGWGYMQADEFDLQLGNIFSSNPEELRRLGLRCPSTSELLRMPTGKYTLAQLKEAA